MANTKYAGQGRVTLRVVTSQNTVIQKFSALFVFIFNALIQCRISPVIEISFVLPTKYLSQNEGLIFSLRDVLLNYHIALSRVPLRHRTANDQPYWPKIHLFVLYILLPVASHHSRFSFVSDFFKKIIIPWFHFLSMCFQSSHHQINWTDRQTALNITKPTR